ncbi:hypothetical protein MMB232_00188 [Brevundimonas subvibrioides]|uniref:CPBP family intramembrane glutamic endopeptidase n=1 Tax=Brevundimonas subvibrioides TaxID=74313 RepID=UPI0032D58F99
MRDQQLADSHLTLRRFSQFIALALAALIFWAWFVRPEAATRADDAISTYVIAGLLVAAILGVVFLALRFGASGITAYWRGASGSDQVRPVATLIATTLAIHLAVGALQFALGILDPNTATAASLLVWTLVPAAFLQFGLVQWPARQRTASTLTLMLFAVPAATLMAALSYNSFLKADGPMSMPAIGPLTVVMAKVVVAAAAEDVVFRVLFLTALLDRTASRFQAVFLSSVLFAAMHAPLFFLQPVIQGDWQLLALVAGNHASVFAMQVLVGLVFGVIWLRTGSIALISVLHAILNIGPALARD